MKQFKELQTVVDEYQIQIVTTKETEAEKASYRFKIINEILDTEKSYVNYLVSIDEFYIEPLTLFSNSEEPIITKEDIQKIFLNIKEIKDTNIQFFIELEKRVENWDITKKLGDLFETFVPQFQRAYTHYLEHYSIASKHKVIVQERNKKSHDLTFEKLLVYIRQFKTTSNKSLEDLLIMPVQRIPRYEMLLNQLKQKTPDGHEDKTLLEKALVDIISLDKHLNENNRLFEILADLPNKILGYEKIQENEERRLLCYGKSVLVSPKKILDCQLYFCTDKIIICKDASKGKRKSILKGEKNTPPSELLKIVKVFDFDNDMRFRILESSLINEMDYKNVIEITQEKDSKLVINLIPETKEFFDKITEILKSKMK